MHELPTSLPARGRSLVRDGLVHKTVADHPQQVADIVATLSWSVRDSAELLEYLQLCADLAVQVIRGAHCAGVTAHLGAEPFTAVHTDALTLEVDAHQYAAGDGPCLHAMRTGALVVVDVATSRERWPEFTTDAENAGIHSFLAAPIGTPDLHLGALNLYSHDPDGFQNDDAALTLMITDHASRALLDHQERVDAAALAEQLQTAMRYRAPIEQAKGILMAAHQITATEAFQLLRKQSQDTNTKLHDLAATFLTDNTGEPSPPDTT